MAPPGEPSPLPVSGALTPLDTFGWHTYSDRARGFAFDYPPAFVLATSTDQGGPLMALRRCIRNVGIEAPHGPDLIDTTDAELAETCQLALAVRLLDLSSIAAILASKWEYLNPDAMSLTIARAAQILITDRECRNEASLGALGSSAIQRGQFDQRIFVECTTRSANAPTSGFEAPEPYALGDAIGYSTLRHDSDHVSANQRRHIFLAYPQVSTTVLLEFVLPIGESAYTAGTVGSDVLSTFRLFAD